MTAYFTPKEPSKEWLSSYSNPDIIASPGYTILRPKEIAIKLDQNEIPFDWPESIKYSVSKRIVEKWPWNRYQPAYFKDLEDDIGKLCGVPGSSVLIGPGSNYMITVVMDLFCRHAKGIVKIAKPSFPLYEEHARYYQIPYEPWEVTKDYTYDLDALKNLPADSVVIFASPNNPTGSLLARKDLENLLQQHPSTMFIADEAYFEFSDEPYTPLLKNYSNLIIIRTFSKILGSAAIRLGYVIGSFSAVHEMRKLVLPYLVNAFTYEAAKEVLSNKNIQDFLKTSIDTIKSQRDMQYERFKTLSQKQAMTVYPSSANFLMLRWHDPKQMQDIQKALTASDCLVRDISKQKGLAGCLRITIGSAYENQRLFELMESA